MEAKDILLYVNIVLGLCAIIELTAFAVLIKKTSCAMIAGVVAVVTFGLAVVMFVVQLIMFAVGNGGAEYAVYICTAVMGCALISGAVYCALLHKNSHAALCVAAAVCQVLPPVGMILAVVLSYKMKNDTHVQKLVFNGYALTYAALDAFCDKHKADFIDSSGDEDYPTLAAKEIKLKLKAMKAEAKSDDSKALYEYASAVLNYAPIDRAKAIKCMIKSAELGYAPAQFNLGYCYETGAFVRRDYKIARRYYEKAIENADSDAQLRLGILSVKEGNAQQGMDIFKTRVENKGDLAAKFNMGVCYECGLGVDKDMDRALDIYTECGNAGLFAAQNRMFAIAGKDINSPQNGEFFRKVTDRMFDGTFGLMMHGLIQIKRRMAADASEYFLSAVERHDEWEGVARCLVGTLYIDCGKTENDRQNGMEYIKSAIPRFPEAREVCSSVKRSMLKARPDEKK